MFRKLDPNKSGVVNLNNMKKFYCTKKHPKVVSGKYRLLFVSPHATGLYICSTKTYFFALMCTDFRFQIFIFFHYLQNYNITHLHIRYIYSVVVDQF